mmetsp:Transcript_50829/g.75325  ORF Transcript_50829/g.75325 Transcript_50829/m.75325 type:complete len:419 (+) Transcript_50829:91-1347(+)
MSEQTPSNDKDKDKEKDKDKDKDKDNDAPLPSLSSTLRSALMEIESSPNTALNTLLELQKRIASSQVLSSNESLDDIPTWSLPLLSVDYHLGMAYQRISSKNSVERLGNLNSSKDLFHHYLRRMEALEGGVMDGELLKDYHWLLDMDQELQEAHDTSMEKCDYQAKRRTRRHISRGESREAKIARLKLSKRISAEVSQLNAQKERRRRLNMDDEEEVDGMDDEALHRALYVKELKGCAVKSVEELHQGAREVEMVKMAVLMEQRRDTMALHRNHPHQEPSSRSNDDVHPTPPKPNQPNSPMEVTRVSQNPQTGQLLFRREQIRSNVFQPSWNQPTMTLQQLADIEVEQAMQRSEHNRLSEQRNKLQPRRYDQLLKDEMEDDDDLVEKSAVLDRKWDDFKDDNPRGMGNKLADRGDRNF